MRAAPHRTSKEATTEIFSNTVSFEVYPAPFVMKINLEAPTKIKRGQVIQLPYSCIRNNQFIGKIHTEIRAPGGVVGIRGRGVSFVGQTETGVIQIIANEDADPEKGSGIVMCCSFGDTNDVLWWKKYKLDTKNKNSLIKSLWFLHEKTVFIFFSLSFSIQLFP